LNTLKKESDRDQYDALLQKDRGRSLLVERIKAIKAEGIKEIKIGFPEEIEKRFFDGCKKLKPRHQRDIKRITSIIKCFALLNLWWRKRDGSTITANKADINEAFKIWEKISASQELNLPPYIYDLYKDVILDAWDENGGTGLTRKDITKKHYEAYGRMVDTTRLRQQIIPMLETAGLICQESDPNDKRNKLICPTPSLTKK